MSIKNKVMSGKKSAKPKFEDVIKKVDFLQTGHQSICRQIVRGVYSIQKERISTGNKLCSNFYVKIGVEPGSKIDSADNWGKEILEYYLKEFNRLSDFVSKQYRNLQKVLDKHKGVISSKAEFALVKSYITLYKEEKFLEKQLGDYLEAFPIWTEFLKQVPGIGPLMGGVIISEIDIHKALYVSSIWKYAGLDVVQVKDEKTGEMRMEGRGRKSSHLIKVLYKNREGKEKIKDSITFNPFLKTKLLGVAGTSILKQHGARPNKYGQIYYDYKNRLIQRRNLRTAKISSESELSILDAKEAARKEWPDARIHSASIRYMIKILLKDLYVEWRTLEKLPVMPSYEEAKLGINSSRHTFVS